MSLRLTFSLFLLTAGLALPGSAATLLTENWEGAAAIGQGGTGLLTGDLAGTGFRVSSGNVMMWQFTSAGDGPVNTTKYLTTFGNTGQAEVESLAAFNLFAGNTYTLTFDLSGPGGGFGNGPFDWLLRASLGSLSSDFTGVWGYYYVQSWSTKSVTWTSTVSQENVRLKFFGKEASNVQCCQGFPHIDNIVLTETQNEASAVPEPSTWALLSAAGVAFAASRRRR
jgi:hypothetical protein